MTDMYVIRGGKKVVPWLALIPNLQAVAMSDLKCVSVGQDFYGQRSIVYWSGTYEEAIGAMTIRFKDSYAPTQWEYSPIHV